MRPVVHLIHRLYCLSCSYLFVYRIFDDDMLHLINTIVDLFLKFLLLMISPTSSSKVQPGLSMSKKIDTALCATIFPSVYPDWLRIRGSIGE